jgi:phage terminase large subunit
MRDNPYLSNSVVMDYEGSLDEKQKRMRVGGEFVMHEGLIYDEFRLDMHLCDRFEIPDDWPIIAGIDFGSNHPTAMSVITGVDDTWFVIEEYKMGGADIETHAGNMLAILAGYFGQVKKVVGDPSAKILITEYGKYGLYIQKAKNDVHSGINRVKVLLKPRPVMGQGMEPKLFVFNDLIKTVEEFGLYRWADRRRGGLDNIDGLDHPEKENDHILDALRYAVMSLDNSTFQSITSGVMPIIKGKRRHNLQYLKGYQ